MMRLIPLPVLIVALAGCASLGEDQCLAGNWHEIGVEDGAEGRETDWIERHAEACAGYGIAPDRAAWLSGREAGLALYCTPANAYDLGRAGRTLRPVCPAAAMAALEEPYRAGQRQFEIGEQIDETEDRLREIRAEIAALPPGDPRIALLNADYARWIAELSRLRALQISGRRYSLLPSTGTVPATVARSPGWARNAPA